MVPRFRLWVHDRSEKCSQSTKPPPQHPRTLSPPLPLPLAAHRAAASRRVLGAGPRRVEKKGRCARGAVKPWGVVHASIAVVRVASGGVGANARSAGVSQQRWMC